MTITPVSKLIHKNGEDGLTVNTDAETPDPHLSPPLTIPQDPFDDVKVKPALVSEAVKVAQMPDVYHEPELMMQPVFMPLATVTSRNPLPEKGAPGAEVGPGVPTVVPLVVVVGEEVVDLDVVMVLGVVVGEIVGEVVGAGAPDLGL